jgi:hypothetical protein
MVVDSQFSSPYPHFSMGTLAVTVDTDCHAYYTSKTLQHSKKLLKSFTYSYPTLRIFFLLHCQMIAVQESLQGKIAKTNKSETLKPFVLQRSVLYLRG